MPQPVVFLETSRLLLRSWQPSDRDTYVRMNADPEVRRYFPDLLSKELSLLSMEKMCKDMDARGYGLFALEIKATATFIGYVGFAHSDFPTPCVEIGWRLDKTAWGKGYATEGARACLSAGFERWGFPEVYAFTSIHNHPSENVMRRIGMERMGTFEHPHLPEGHWLREHVLYRIADITCVLSSGGGRPGVAPLAYI